MFDYKLLEALEMVVRAGSFEGAGKRLHLSQSAVSQRIRLLEDRMGAVLLVRDVPVRATPAGEKLLTHVRKVRALEDALKADSESRGSWQRVRIGVNADSLAIGLIAALATTLRQHYILLETVVDDEGYTLDLLKAGEVSACLSTHATPPPGCDATALGVVPYVFVATPAFVDHFFGNGVDATALAHAPAAVYGRKQSLHRRWLAESHNLNDGTYPCHEIPDSAALYQAALAGLAYGVVPLAQASQALGEGTLARLVDETLDVPLYWHQSAHASPALAALTSAMRDFALSTQLHRHKS
ncbi:LysR family transcriptional regulator ArgP [Chitinibacteraceae bacterium HSL-7]